MKNMATAFVSSLSIGFAVLFSSAVSSVDAALIAHYSLDGNGNDSSGNGNHGSVNSAIATTDRFGHTDAALSFDGVDDYVDAPQLLFNGDDATVAFWAKSAGEQNTYSIMVSQGHGFFDGFAFQYGYPEPQTNSLIFGIGGDSWETLDFSLDLEVDTDWHHYAFTKSGTTVSIYLDGDFITASAFGLSFSTYGFTIGRDSVNTERLFHGSIDDVYVFDTALTEGDIEGLMAAPVPEPTSMALVLLGAAGLCCAVLYRHKKHDRLDLHQTTE